MIKNILTNLKIEQLNAMQEAAIDTWKEGKDLILLSPTGSGKTLAYLLPLLQSLKPDAKGVQAIVLVPSRELALQIDQVFKSMNTPFKAVSCYGGRPAIEEHRTIKGVQPSVVIGTPGRMNDHLSKQNIDAETVTTLVIDEFDKCLEFGFQEEMATVIGQLPRLKRRFLLSATDAEEIPQFTGLNKTIKLNFLNTEEQTVQRLHLYKVLSPGKDKLETLYKFRNGSCHVLISTDLAARGLDIPEIENVVHYHLPVNEDGYIHRNGRTARWEAEGNSYILLHQEEMLPEYLTEVPEEFLLPEVTPKPSLPEFVTLYIGKGKKDKINKIDIVGFLFKKGNLNKDEIGRIDVKDHYSFAAVSRKKIKQTLNLIQNEKIKGVKTLIEEAK